MLMLIVSDWCYCLLPLIDIINVHFTDVGWCYCLFISINIIDVYFTDVEIVHIHGNIPYRGVASLLL